MINKYNTYIKYIYCAFDKSEIKLEDILNSLQQVDKILNKETVNIILCKEIKSTTSFQFFFSIPIKITRRAFKY